MALGSHIAERKCVKADGVRNSVFYSNAHPRFAEPQSISEKDWSVSQNKHFRASIIVWGMPKSLSTLEIWAKLADIGLAGFARGSVALEGDHVRLLLLPKDSKDVVGRISACLRKIGCRCVLDESQKAWAPAGVQVNITCSNGFCA